MRLDATEGKDKKNPTGARENSGRRTRIGAEHADYVNYEKLERKNPPTSFRGMSTARERTTSSRCRNEDGTFPQRRRWENEERKEGRKDGVGGAEETREGDESIRVSPCDRFNEKNVRSRPEIDSGGR